MAMAYFRSQSAAAGPIPADPPNGVDSIGSRLRSRPIPGTWLVRGDSDDFELGVLLIPVGADVLKGEAEGLALAWCQRRNAQVDGIGIGAGGLENMQRNLFSLRQLAHFVFEDHFDGGMGNGLTADIGDGSVQIGYGRADEVLRPRSSSGRKA